MIQSIVQILKFNTQHSTPNIQHYLILLLLSLSHFLTLYSSHAQAFNDIEWYDVDSLLSVLPGQEGEERLQTLNFLAASLSFEDKNESEKRANQALALAIELGDRKGKANAYRNLGRKEFYDGIYPKALNYYQEALLIYEETDNFYLQAQVLEDIATTHYFAGNLDKAFEIMDMALAVYRQKKKEGIPVGDVRDTMTIFSRIGLPYRQTGRSDTARLLYLRYLDIGKKNNFEITDMMVHNGLLAMCYYEIGEYDSALFYLKKSFDFPDVNESIKALKHQHMRYMAYSYIEMGSFDSALLMLKTSYAWFSERGFLRQSQWDTRLIGDIYLSMGKLPQAENFYRLSETLLNEMIERSSIYRHDSLKYTVSFGYELYLPVNKNDMKEGIYLQAVELYRNMYELYYQEGRLSESIKYLANYADTKDTLRAIQSNRESIEIQTKYETERKDSEINILSQQNKLKEMQLKQTRWFVTGLGGMIILIILLAAILIRQSRLKAAQEKLIIQQKLLRSQMNPHFLFNSLTSIQNFMIQEKDSKASTYLSRFSRLMRHILDSSTQETVTLEEEIDTIENYLALQKVRYRDMFNYEFIVDENVDPEIIMVPPMLAQPFIENSIDHGFKNKEGKGNLSIRFSLSGSMLKLEIEDDGIGRKKAMEILEKQNKDHRSMATNITRERLEALNRKSKKKIVLHIEDLYDSEGDPAGTRVSFEIPV